MAMRTGRLLAVLLASLLAAGTAATPQFDLSKSDAELFAQFQDVFPRTYSTPAERNARFAAFKNHTAEARRLNAAPRDPGHTALHGITKFADLLPSERAAYLGGAEQPRHERARRTSNVGTNGCLGNPPFTCANLPRGNISDSFDWRNHPNNVVTPVKNQGECGGCWAFTAVEVIESAWRIAGNYPTEADEDLSVQQILSCDHTSGGCNGGQISAALRYVHDISEAKSGLLPERADPYRCGNGCATQPTCPPLQQTSVASINSTCSCLNLRSQEEEIRAVLATVGPVGVNVDSRSWMTYLGGIIRNHCCSDPMCANHAVSIVGYGIDETITPAVKYWIVRNSWGSDWGEAGYIRLMRDENVCGVGNEVSFVFSSDLV
eukprot:m.146951 g.146951  ORF g.146951 m.146951 type:complete len:377 (+) comp10097_c0_seq6:239-1369(+)